MKNISRGTGFLVIVLVVGALIILLAVWSAGQDVKEYEQIKHQEVIQEQRAQEMGEAMQGIKEDIEHGYEVIDDEIAE